MKIKLLTCRAGVGFVQNRGEVIDVSDSEAISLINAGQAEPVREAPIERAVATKREKAAK